MPRQNLLEYFRPDSRPGGEIAVSWRRGYRMVRWTYTELLRVSVQFAQDLEGRGVGKGDRVLLWGENCGEWVASFLGCIFCGAIAVPMDASAEKTFAARVVKQSGARIAVVGREQSALETVPSMPLEGLATLVGQRSASKFQFVSANREDPIEIVFTSGTTAEPRGVVLTHGNVLANLEPLEKEIDRYRRYEKFFHPIRFLDLLPLSHVFGQLLGVFLPQILGGTSVFVDTLNPTEVIRVTREERVSVLVTVPRLVESLRDQIERDLAARDELERFRRSYQAAESEHFLKRWWRFRRIRSRFGWKFLAIISGGAALPSGPEEFWARLGYAVVQGYGLTETTSLVSVNHPFQLSQGSIGKSLPGLEVKLSPEGEILVRGENIASGYWKDAGVAPVLDTDGWFHTGDLGERDASGTLFFKGRRKNVIVTPEGLNVYPQDLEAELRKDPRVRDCIVVGLERDGNAVPCAVLLLRDSQTSAESIVQRANESLADFQQMRQWYAWPESDFPRTPTQKPFLKQIKDVVEQEVGNRQPTRAAGSAASPVQQILSRVSGDRRPIAGNSAKIQLSSIERVELFSALEDRYQVDLSETDFQKADTVAALEKLVERPDESPRTFHYPRWAQMRGIRWIRTAVFYVLQRPAMLLLGWPKIRGRENLRDIKGPILVVSNHIGYVDPAYIIAALPARLRHRLAVAMDGELLETMRKPPEGAGWFIKLFLQTQYFLVVALFNVFPLPQRSGFRKSFAFAGELVDMGQSVLVFPEGIRTQNGLMNPFRSGIGLLATRLQVPVVPMRVDGLFERKIDRKHWAPPGWVRVAIGKPVVFTETAAAEEVARELGTRVAALGENPNSADCRD